MSASDDKVNANRMRSFRIILAFWRIQFIRLPLLAQLQDDLIEAIDTYPDCYEVGDQFYDEHILCSPQCNEHQDAREPKPGFSSKSVLTLHQQALADQYLACGGTQSLVMGSRVLGILRTARLCPRRGSARRPVKQYLRSICRIAIGKLRKITDKTHTTGDLSCCGDLGGIRTHDPRIRNPVLYPAELRDHGSRNTSSVQCLQGWVGAGRIGR